MNELDRKIQQALSEQDAELFKEISNEPGMFEMLIESFRGKYWWLNALTAVWSLVFFVLAIASAVKFYRAVEAREMMLWALAFMFCMLAVAMLKIWFWMELNKNAITREIKRVELQIARLAGRIKT